MSRPPGRLWIVATPIGTIDDLAPRARQVLSEADLLIAEDTRRTRRLLTRAQIAARGKLMSLHEHNEVRVVPKVLRAMHQGQSVALVSDAGTPVLSDPGFVLVREARRQNLHVLSIPGASAFTTALAASGQPPLPATLAGFLPPRAGARQRRIAELATVPWTIVLFLSPHRLALELGELASGLGRSRPATLLAELSKMHERAIMADLGELSSHRETIRPRGEYVLVVGPGGQAGDGDHQAPSDEEIRAEYEARLAHGDDRQEALRQTVRQLKLRRRDVYRSLFVDRRSRESSGRESGE